MPSRPMPPRRLFGQRELQAVIQVFERSWETGMDFGYQQHFENSYTQAFCDFQGGGYADAICTGTAAVLVALAALDLKTGSEIMVSPVTDPGGISPAIILGHSITICDAAPGSFNMGPQEFEDALTPRTRAAIVTHVGGIPAHMDEILELARKHGVALIEDCSQAHGACWNGQRVGTFGTVSAFSTMFSKNHASGSCGGLAYTPHADVYRRIRSLADRGKDFFHPNFDPKDPTQALFPALNLNQDEISCAIGKSTLEKLPEIINRRSEIVDDIACGLDNIPGVFPVLAPPEADPSYFFLTVLVDQAQLGFSKLDYATRLSERGVWLNPDYKYTVASWPWAVKYITGNRHTPNVMNFRERTFNLLFHEGFLEQDIQFILAQAAELAREKSS